MAAIVQAQEGLEQRNFHHLVMDIAWFAVALAATTRFLQFFAIRMGADSMAVSLMTAIPSIVLVLSVGASSWWRSRYYESTKAVWIPSIIFRFVYLLPAFAPFFPIEWRVIWLIIGASLPAIGQGVSSSIFMVMMRETVPATQIPALLSRRNVALNLMLLLGVIGFGLLLEYVPYPYNYQLMFVLAFGFSMLSQWHIGQMKPIVPSNKPQRATGKAMLELFKNRHFQSVAYLTLITHIGFFAVVGVVPVFLTDNLGASETYFMYFGVVELLAGAAIMFLVERLFKQFGSRGTIIAGMIFTALGAFSIAVAPNLEFALLGAAFTGSGWSVASVALLRFFMERTNADDITASTAFHQVLFMAVFVGPLLGGSLASLGISLPVILVLGASLRLLVALLAHLGLGLFGMQKVAPITEA